MNEWVKRKMEEPTHLWMSSCSAVRSASSADTFISPSIDCTRDGEMQCKPTRGERGE